MQGHRFRILLHAALCGVLAWGCNETPERTSGRATEESHEHDRAHGHAHENAHGGEHAHGGAGAREPTIEPVPRPQIPDVVLTDQHGQRHRFYSDLVAGKLVLMNAIFTSCAGSCPVQTQIFAGVQRALGDRVGQDVQMLSVSLDPTIDTPERLQEFADRHGAKPGWLFLTGPRPDVTKVLRAMDLYAADPQQHTPIAVLGNEPTGVWMKTINLAAPIEIVKKLERVATLDLNQVVNR